MRFFLKHKVLLVAVIAIVLVLTLSVVSALTDGYASPVSNALGSIFKPFQTAIAGFSDKVASWYGYMYEFDTVKAENEQLKMKIAQMEEEARLSEASNEENARLRQLLGLSERKRDLALEASTITSHDVSNWASTFTISKGTNFGIKPRDCVINEEYFLVGVVSEVGANWATVVTVIDTDLEAGAYNFRTGQLAVAKGNFDLMRQGRLRLSYLPKDADVKNGDLVLTSGIGGLFPRDLVIGAVEGVQTDETGISAFAVIHPSAQLGDLKQVFVVKSFDISE